MPRGDGTALARLRRVIGPAVATSGCDLEALTVTPVGRRRLVRVVVDRDGGVDLDAVADVTRAVSAALDEADPMGGDEPYLLEVSSPGVDRPLTEPRHWRRALGRLVRVRVAGVPVVARVLAADEHGVRLGEPAAGHGDAAWPAGSTGRPVGYPELGAGAIQVEFEAAPGARSGGGGEA